MATILGQITVNQVDILEVSADPSAGAGTPASLGSLATQADGGGLWIKTGPNDVDWAKYDSGLIVSGLPCLQIRRSTTATLGTSYADVTFNLTDVETHPDVIEHNNTNTDDIDIKETGAYKITYTFPGFYQSSDAAINAKFRKNDTTDILGSWMHNCDSIGGSENEISNDFIALLVAGDKITMQAKKTGTASVVADLVVTVIKLQGLRGEQGLTGSGSTITLQDEGTPVTSTPHSILNFTGAGVSVTNVGDGRAEIVITDKTYGSSAQDANSETESSTSSTSYQQKLRMTTTSLPSGRYRIGWSYRYRNSSTYDNFLARVQVNDTDTLMLHQQMPQSSSSTQKIRSSGFVYRNLSGVQNIDLDYCSDDTDATVYIAAAGLEIWRVS